MPDTSSGIKIWRGSASGSSQVAGRPFWLAIGPAGEVYREAGNEAERQHDKLVAALKDELKEFFRPEGVMMDSSSWMVTAQNPGSSSGK